MEKQTLSFSQKLFRALVRVLPFDFRMNYEGEMEGVFREQQREVEERGGFFEALKLWKETIVGIFTTAPKERWFHCGGDSYSRPGHRSQHRHLQRSALRASALASLSAGEPTDFYPPAG